MKKFVLLLVVLIMLIIATGAVSAGKPEPEQFTITGYTTFYDCGTLPNGRTWFHIRAQSSGATEADNAFCTALMGMPCQATCEVYLGKPCGVTGALEGQFTFEEWGEGDLDCTTAVGSGIGKNNGVVKITPTAKPHGKPDGRPDGTVVVQFNGKTDWTSVWGKFKIEKANGKPEKQDGKHPEPQFKGQGDYKGGAGLVFSVTFTGKLKD
jgi:hypothetical protein